MNRRITTFEIDADNDWVAILVCTHRQHVRHGPPFRAALWVLDELTRNEHVGTFLDCPLCDRAELPEGLKIVRTTGVWDDNRGNLLSPAA